MAHTFDNTGKPAILALCLALAIPGQASAQMTGGAGLSSGSGSGTGAGGRTGVLRNQSGSLSGAGPRAVGDQSVGDRPLPPLSGSRARRPLSAFGPGVDVTFPNDPYLLPFMELEQPGVPLDKKAPTHITNELLKNARLITSPDERSLALQRIANGAIASRQLYLAHQMLEEATTATSDVTIPLVRDQRLIAIVTSMASLTDAMLLQGRQVLNESVGLDPDSARPEALPKGSDPTVLIRTCRLEWKRAYYLAGIIGNPTYRNEMLYRVAESMASGSASVANYVSAPIADPSKLPPAAAAPPKPAVTPEPARAAQAKPKPADNDTFKKTADDILVDSFDVAKKIDRLIWKYRAMVRIALLAADSEQYSRGFELSRGIENGESRAEAMLLLAEAQTRSNQNDAATASYAAAAQAVSTVTQDGLRGVLAGFVVDSLIASGRFEDARACIVLYPRQDQQLVALGAIAESQGRRGSGESARLWIAGLPEEFRPTLYRRVATGVLSAIEQNRSKEFDPASPLP